MENNIIEKLDIKPLKQYYNKILDLDIFSTQEIREVENQRNEMLKALIDGILKSEKHGGSLCTESMYMAIEKVCNPKKWSEIILLLP